MRDRPSHPSGLHAFVARGPNTGTLLFPHKHRDGMYAVSPSRYETDYTRVANPGDLLKWVEKGFCVRMSNKGVGVAAPSLIEPGAIFRAVQL